MNKKIIISALILTALSTGRYALADTLLQPLSTQPSIQPTTQAVMQTNTAFEKERQAIQKKYNPDKIGFRDMILGDPLSKLGPDVKQVYTNTYTRNTDKLFIGSVPLKSIEYTFKKDILTDIKILYKYRGDKYSDYSDIIETFSAKYGKPESTRTYRNNSKTTTWWISNNPRWEGDVAHSPQITIVKHSDNSIVITFSSLGIFSGISEIKETPTTYKNETKSLPQDASKDL